MEQAVLMLKTGVRQVQRKGMEGLVLDGREKLAKDRNQAGILAKLLKGPQTTDCLKAGIAEEGKNGSDDTSSAITLAEFILDFKEYLEG
jgi:hypothetical protein